MKSDISQSSRNCSASTRYEGCECTSGRAEDASHVSAPVASVAVFMDGNAVALAWVQAAQVDLDSDCPVA